MEANKVILNGTTLIDLTEDTATVNDVRIGKTFHSADGVQRTGELDPTGGEDVFLYDPYGNVIKSYSKNQFLALTEYPATPTLQGLTFQEYNWSLSDAKAYVTSHGKLNIGATYKTTSGLTEFDIELTKATGLTITFQMEGNTNWGDGTSETTSSSSTHTYTDYGKYTITCDGTTIPNYIFGSGTIYCCTSIRVGENISSLGYQSLDECYSLRSIIIPNTVTSIGSSAFGTDYSLTSIIIPSSVISIGGSAFESCGSLLSVSIGSGVTSIGNYAFSNCKCLVSITIPDNVTSIGNNAFQNCAALASLIIGSGVTYIDAYTFTSCGSLTSVTIPNSVTTIGLQSFSNCYKNLLFDFSQASSVPTLLLSSAFLYMNRLCKIVVPDALYESWITASQWSDYANRIYKVSEVTT